MKTKIKTFLSKAKAWCAKYWYLLLASLVLVLMAIGILKKDSMQSLYESLMKKYRANMQASGSDLQEVSDIREQEQRNQEQIDQEYKEAIRVLREKHKESLDTLSTEQEREINRILADSNRSPEEMANKVSQVLGIPVSARVEEHNE